MLSLLVAAVLAPTTLTLAPTDDVWVYPHASDPQKDPFLRIWGAEARAVAPSADAASDYSYGYLRFDRSAVSSDAKLVSAKLTVYQVADPGYGADQAKATPLEARGIGTNFTEKAWTYDQVNALAPIGEPFGKVEAFAPEAGKDVPLVIDLMKGKGDFAKAFGSAKDFVGIALTSAIDPATGGQRAVYKVYSKDAPNPAVRPKLELTYEKSAR